MDRNILYGGVIVGLIFVFILLILWARYEEKKAYNRGFCLRCGTKMRNFDMDSQGGRGYCCDKCHYHTWVSYRIDKKYLES